MTKNGDRIQEEGLDSKMHTLVYGVIHFVLTFRTVSRVIRVIGQPRGNMLLVGIGGSGRQSLTKLAVSVCEYSTFQIEVTRQYRKTEFRDGEYVTDTQQNSCSHHAVTGQ